MLILGTPTQAVEKREGQFKPDLVRAKREQLEDYKDLNLNAKAGIWP